jgi:hypothetical protein
MTFREFLVNKYGEGMKMPSDDWVEDEEEYAQLKAEEAESFLAKIKKMREE